MNNKVAVGILAVISLASIVYGFVQQTAAVKAGEIAEVNLVLAQKAQGEAKQSMERAEKAEALAVANLKLAEQKMIECELRLAKCKCPN